MHTYLVNNFQPCVGNININYELRTTNYELRREGLSKIGEKFMSYQHVGPKFVADFEELIDLEVRDILQRDAYERVNYLLEQLEIR